MKTRYFSVGSSVIVILLTICSILYLVNFSVYRAATGPSDSPYTAPGEASVTVISSSNSQILVQACSFTSVLMANTLVDASNRGFSVSEILEKDQQEARQCLVARSPAKAKIPTFAEVQGRVSPDGSMVIGGETATTASFDRIASSL
jgi:hypothetical protein